MSREWIMASPDLGLAAKLSSDLRLNPITAKVLVNRGITTTDEALLYLEPLLKDIPDPFLLPDMEIAVDRIAAAIGKRERVGIFGDYDADGITGTALLAGFLKPAGIDPLIELPDRMGEGYGLTIGAVDKFHDQGVTLIVTVDNGTRAANEIAHAVKLGIDVVVTDHHQADGAMPGALAVVNPMRAECPGAFTSLSGCGVAFLLVEALKKRLGISFAGDSKEHLDLVAIGTIADVVSLTGANRILVRHGLDEIARGSKVGIAALLDVAGTDPARLSPDAVAFQLAPRINAAGRIASARLAFDLLMSEDACAARDIAKNLDRANRERQQLEVKILEDAARQFEDGGNWEGRSAIVLHSKGWHIGVIGIAAAKMAEKFSRPAFIITRDLKPARGSARTVSGINLVSALSECGDLLERYGGHAMAAGLAIREENLDAFARRMNEVCGQMMTGRTPDKLSIDSIARPEDLSANLINEIARCRPFGMGNSEPVLALMGASIADRRILKEKHLKLKVRAEGITFDAIGFGMADRFPADLNRASIAFTPELNTWNGNTTVQLKIRDIRSNV